MIIDSLMKRGVVMIASGASARVAASLMRDRRVGSVVVEEGGIPIGIVTEGDLARKVVAEGRDAERATAKEIMSAPVATIEPSASVEEAAAMMKRLGVKRLVVVLDGSVRGIVTATDIAYAEPALMTGLLDGWIKQRWDD